MTYRAGRDPFAPRPRRKPRAKRLDPALAALLDRLPTSVRIATDVEDGPPRYLPHLVAWCRLGRKRIDHAWRGPAWHTVWQIVRCPFCGQIDHRHHWHPHGPGVDPYQTDCLGPRCPHCYEVPLPFGATYILVPLPLAFQPPFARAYYDAHAQAAEAPSAATAPAEIASYGDAAAEAVRTLAVEAEAHADA